MPDCIHISRKTQLKSNSNSSLDFASSSQSNIIKRSRHQSRKYKHRHLSKGQKRFNAVVHVTIRPSNDPRNSKARSHRIDHSHTRTHRHHLSSLRENQSSSQHHEKKEIKDFCSDKTATTEDYREKLKKTKEKKCPRRCRITSILLALMIVIVMAVVLPIVLIKSNKITTTFNPTPSLRWNMTGITLFGTSGIAGNDSAHLNQPRDAIFVYPNLLYIADSKNNRIQKYMFGDLVATTVAGQANGVGGSLATHLDTPPCVRVDSADGVYVADLDNNRVQFWSKGASSGETVAGNTTTGPMNATNRLNFPYGIDRDINSDTLYVADYGNARIMSYAPGASSGIVVAGGNGQGRNNTQLFNPIRVYFDSLSNSLIITNHLAHTIVRWVLGANNWTLLAGDPAGIVGSNVTQLRYPMDAIFDPMGNMYVADKDNHRIQLFMAGQSEGITIAGITNIFGSNSTLLWQPWSVRLDTQLNLYVADSRNHRIQKFVRY